MEPAKDPKNWTEHTHSDGRRYYYNKAGKSILPKTSVEVKICLETSKSQIFSTLTRRWLCLLYAWRV